MMRETTIRGEPDVMKKVRMFGPAGMAINYGIARVFICLWLMILGEGNLSWSTNDEMWQTLHYSNVPPAILFLLYGSSVLNIKELDKRKWPLYTFPIILFLIHLFASIQPPSGWLHFWADGIMKWPADYCALWVHLWWTDFGGAVTSCVYIYQLCKFSDDTAGVVGGRYAGGPLSPRRASQLSGRAG
jgi:hypothetical protein